ncbi:methyl-accepting chemotaxis protein [Litchfieldella xinjiangensis]|uniref:methyl-accepting chemotaxis protein n=1 Tax=Litchfieldella xinjiangensis TaxID=1166948 RepID=UPI0005BACA1B|nr:methyl-accepting chemotaxis protein [Halomonas xinjiangensis]
MKLLDNMTVRVSWALVLAVFALLIAVLSGLGLYAVKYSEEALATYNDVNVEQQGMLNRANAQMLDARVAMGEAYENLAGSGASSSEIGMDEIASRLDAAEATFESFLALPRQPGQDALIEPLEASFRALMQEGLRPQFVALDDWDTRLAARLSTRSTTLNEVFYQHAVSFSDAAESSGRTLYNDFFSVSRLVEFAIAAVLFVAVATIAVVLWGVTVNVIRPLSRVVGHFERMAEGDLSERIDSRGNNEIGKLYASLAHMQHSLSRTVATVRDSSQSIYQGAQEISNGNNDLSSRTEQQAASLEETASSMEELTSTVGQNADNARQASQLAASASQTASRGGAVVGDVVTTMRDISESSHKVTEIIKVIDSIAFQTNILALNASVEAARAGEQGRGFAVVAGEVRNLAGRSADASKEIRTLIEASVSKVEAGTALVDQAGDTMEEIVASVQKVTDIMDEIASASQEQSNGIGQVNQAITQMDHVTQQNATLVQQAASAASELELEATRLREAVALFRLSQSEPQAQEDKTLARWLPDLKTATAVSEPKPKSASLPAASRANDDDWEAF